jgi:trehalose 6-phosphate synthase
MVPQVSMVVVSNRGPLSFTAVGDGRYETRRAAGGLATTLGSALVGSDSIWVAAAISDADREAARQSDAGGSGILEAEGFRLRNLVLDGELYAKFYDVVANTTLWYLFHGLFDLPRRPRIDRRWREAWEAYREVNQAFADAAAELAPEGATVLVHDYHLLLVGGMLARRRPDLRSVHFSHTPFCDATAIRVLPGDVAREVLESMSGYRACGFHAVRWAEAYEGSCREVLGRAAPTFVSPAAVDPEDMAGVAGSDDCAAALERLEQVVGDRRLIVRVDRIELSKNLLRGFHAYEDLLRHRPEYRERVVFGAFVYPSRETLPDYLAYRQEVEALVERINSTWSRGDWTPILLDTSDHFPSSVAAMRRYDVLLVNPVRDGLNLVAKEGILVNERCGALALSRETGAWEELGEHALEVNPFDVAGTADVLASALEMPEDEREARASAARKVVAARTPPDWLADQLDAAGSEPNRA